MNNPNTFQKMPRGFDLSQAIAEADRCLLCHDAPCSAGCPAETDPGAFIRKLRLKNITGAIRTVKTNNILGGACGILCPTARLCEKACSAAMRSNVSPGGDDRPIQIGKIQRFLVEHAWETGFKVFDETPKADGPKVAVVGSGPAGLSCAAELAKYGCQATIFEALPEPGGVLRYGVVDYRFNADFLAKELADVRALGVTIQCNSPIGSRRSARDLLKEGFQAVFIATGLWAAARLTQDGREVQGLYSSVEYLKALSDGRFGEISAALKDKTIAVIGGGSVAMDCAQSAAKLGAGDVYLVYRRSWSQMPAEEDERQETQDAGVHYLILNQPREVLEENGRVAGLKLERTRLGKPDGSGRRKPEPVSGSEWTLTCDMVIEAIGNAAEDDSPEWYPDVEVNERNLIQADPETRATSVPGIFAGGDIVRGPALVVNAVQDGKLAARAIRDYLNRKEV